MEINPSVNDSVMYTKNVLLCFNGEREVYMIKDTGNIDDPSETTKNWLLCILTRNRFHIIYMCFKLCIYVCVCVFVHTHKNVCRHICACTI